MIEFVLKASLALLIFFTFYKFLLAKERMFAFNRFFLLFALCFSLVLPILPLPTLFSFEKTFLSKEPAAPVSQFEIDEQDEVVSPPPSFTALETSQQIGTSVSAPINWLSVGLGIYFLGLTLFLSRFLTRIGKIIRTIKLNPNVQGEGFTYVLLHNQTLPYTFFHYFFLDHQIFEDQSLEKEVFYHELTHIRQKHSWDVMLVELLKIIFWFNPLLILFKKAIQLNHEYLADEAVNNEFSDKVTYQILLFQKARRNGIPLSFSSPFNASMTRRRIIMMSKSSPLIRTCLYKAFSVIVSGMTLFFLSSNKPYDSIQTYQGAENDFEELLAQGFPNGDPYQVDLSLLDLPSLRKAYLAMDDEAKKRATEFPFFDEKAFGELEELQKAYPKIKTTIQFHRPPERKQIPNDIYLEWKNTKNIILTIDEMEVESKELDNYLPSDFALFTVRETEKKKLFKKPTYQISLYSDDFYTEKHLNKRKEITEIQSKYPNEIEVSVFYHLPYLVVSNGKLTEMKVENFDASIFHQLKNLDPSLIASGYSKPRGIQNSESFGVFIRSEGNTTYVTRLPLLK